MISLRQSRARERTFLRRLSPSVRHGENQKKKNNNNQRLSGQTMSRPSVVAQRCITTIDALQFLCPFIGVDTVRDRRSYHRLRPVLPRAQTLRYTVTTEECFHSAVANHDLSAFVFVSRVVVVVVALVAWLHERSAQWGRCIEIFARVGKVG